jgi:SAM-dependent methyltransferase
MNGRHAIVLVRARPETEVMAPGERSVRGGIIRLELKRLLQQRRGDIPIFDAMAVSIGKSTQHQIVGVEALGPFTPDPLDFDLAQAWFDGACRLLRALAGCGVLREVQPRKFATTALGEALRTGAPGAARSTVLTLARDWQWQAWHHFIDSLRTGEPGLANAFGMDLFSYLGANPEDGARFDEAMVGMYGGLGQAVLAAHDFSRLDSVIDLGGGTGRLLAAILQSNEHLRGTLFELPETASEARRFFEASGLAARCDVIPGNFFKSVPSGYDAYLLAHVLHGWTDEQALPILRNCRQAIAPAGKLFFVETVLPEGDAPHHGKLMDLLMLTVTGGVERTAEEFAQLLAAANFRLTRIVPTSTHQSVIEAMPV